MISKTDLIARGRTAAMGPLVAIALSTPAVAATTPNDAWITAKVKISLAITDGVHAMDVNVDTVDRQVTLHGSVHTVAEKDLAETTAKTVQGADSVRNLLQVVPAQNEVAVEARDEEISKAVSTALTDEPSLKDSSITVQSVNKGVVLLKGSAACLSDHLTAVEIASEVKGVRRVASEVQSQDTLADADTWKEPNVAVGNGKAHTIRGAASDLYITSKVKMRLLANSGTPAMEINVDTRRGVVTMFGIVPTAASRATAEQEARSTQGVVSVKNQLEVVASANKPAVEAKDDVVQGNVKENLGKSPDFRNVSSEVKNCVARLTGTVASGVDRVEAMQVARATLGVCSVTGDITIE